MEEKTLKLIGSMKTKIKFLEKDLEKIERTLEEENKHEKI